MEAKNGFAAWLNLGGEGILARACTYRAHPEELGVGTNCAASEARCTQQSGTNAAGLASGTCLAVFRTRRPARFHRGRADCLIRSGSSRLLRLNRIHPSALRWLPMQLHRLGDPHVQHIIGGKDPYPCAFGSLLQASMSSRRAPGSQGPVGLHDVSR